MSTSEPNAEELAAQQELELAAQQEAQAQAALQQAEADEAAALAAGEASGALVTNGEVEEPATPDASDQSPVATARDKAIVGDSGMYEQQPLSQGGNPDEPHRTSAPPAALQSGVPLAEDRAAGVTVD